MFPCGSGAKKGRVKVGRVKEGVGEGGGGGGGGGGSERK